MQNDPPKTGDNEEHLPSEPDQSEPEIPAKFSKRKVIILVAIILSVILGVSAGLYVYHHRHKTVAKVTQGTVQPTGLYTGWKTYSSEAEQASFRYPGGWTVSAQSPNGGSGDSVSVKSPSGSITINWDSTITSGFGNEHSATYPANTVLSKTPIVHSPGLYVVSGITTLGGTTYYPWIAVQDSNGIITSQINGDLLLFIGRRNYDGTSTHPANALFSTSGVRAHESSPALTKAQATAWFSSAEAKQAKLILLSLNDPPSQYLTIKEWGVKIPLASPISDLYYAWSDSSNDQDGLESTLSLGLTSLDSECGQAAYGNQGFQNSLAFITRTLPTDRDPVSGKLYSELEPNGVTINGYYYGLSDAGLKSRTCIPQSTIQAVETALATAVGHMVSANPSWQVYKSKVAGFQFIHPADWKVTEGQLNSGAGGEQDNIDVDPPDTPANKANPFGVQFWINSNPDANAQPGALTNGVIQYPPHGAIDEWVTNPNLRTRTSGSSTVDCPELELLTLNPTHFSLALPNGEYLAMTAGYCWGQRSTTTLTYQEQLASANWQTAMSMAQWIEWLP